MENILSKQRVLDDMGRLVIPSSYRKVLKIGENTALSVVLDNNKVLIREEYSPHTSSMPHIVTLDNMNRIEIPKPYRLALGITEKERVDIKIDGGTIVVTRQKNKCAICSNTEDLMKNLKLVVCKKCLESFDLLESE